MFEQVDVIVIGGGTAGGVAACAAHLRGLSVLIIEKTDQFGGTLLRAGVIYGYKIIAL